MTSLAQQLLNTHVMQPLVAQQQATNAAAQTYGQILATKGWTHARKWLRHQKQAAATAWLHGDQIPWNALYGAGLLKLLTK